MEDSVACVPDLGDVEALRKTVADRLLCPEKAEAAQLEEIGCNELATHSLFAVFDGHGGHLVASWAAHTLHGKLARRIALRERAADAKKPADADGAAEVTAPTEQRPPTSGEVGYCLKAALLDVDADLRQLNEPSEQKPGAPTPLLVHHNNQSGPVRRFDYMGSTAVAAVLGPRNPTTRQAEIAVANCGDSRAFKCRAGVAVPLSRDHKPESPRERERIVAAGGSVCKIGPCHRVDFGLNLSRTLGDFAYKKESDPPEKQKISPLADVVTSPIDAEDEFLCVACDGVYELMSWQSCCDFIRKRLQSGMQLERVAEELLDACCPNNPYDTGGLGLDNESVIIVKFDHNVPDPD
jgi:serine/threonine protein phosphatase PrpC